MPQPGSNTWEFKTDGRSFGGGSSRVKAIIEFDSDFIGSLGKFSHSSYEVSGSGSTRRIVWDRKTIDHRDAKNQGDAKYTNPLYEGCKADTFIKFEAHGNYPAVTGSPDIDINGEFGITRVDPYVVKIELLSFEHNDFPNYEVMVDNSNIYSFDTKGKGPKIWNLVFASTKVKNITTYVMAPLSNACIPSMP